MPTPPLPGEGNGSLDALHARFLALVPRIELHARISFRHVKCPDKQADAIAETLAIAWQWYVRLVERGKDPAEFVTTFASLAARHVKAGRKVCGQENSRDALSPLAQQRHGFTVSPLPAGSSLNGNIFDQALHDNTRTPVDEQVCFRLDFPSWRRTRTDRDRRVIDHLMVGERTLDVSQRYGLSPGRISQMRREFRQDWMRFCGEPTPLA